MEGGIAPLRPSVTRWKTGPLGDGETMLRLRRGDRGGGGSGEA